MSLPEPNWQPLETPGQGNNIKGISRRVDLEARQIVCRNLGRKWTRKHDVAWTAYMVRNGYLPADSLEQAREEYREERAIINEQRLQSGLHRQGSFRVW